ncbi:MAG: ABC transporter ATP-binding protein [Firmicutes bacterium]|nr:ABC transporter ATP-binding protein [Bacillota bacterium]
MLSVDHVTKKYGDFLALEDITLDFEAGVYGLLAPNGAGKTTLINMLTTLLSPTKGEIRWEGTDIFALREVYRDVLGYLPQQFGYYRDNTPQQFLRYLAALKGIPPKRGEKRILKLMELVGLSDVLNKKMKKFSGGMLQRVGIAAAMLNDPKLLILDEPTAGLDPRERVRFRNLIHMLSQNRIVILSTHIVSDIETIASKIVMIRDHHLCCCKPPQEICSSLKGRIFEIPAAGKPDVPYQLLSERQSPEGGTRLRIACKTAPSGAYPAEPNLEDVFLYVYDQGEGVSSVYDQK